MWTMDQDHDTRCVSPLNIPQGFMAWGLMNPERAHGCDLLCQWQLLACQLGGGPREGLCVGGLVGLLAVSVMAEGRDVAVQGQVFCHPR